MSEFGQVVYTSPQAAACQERALVLRSQGIESILGQVDGGHALLVAPQDVDAARHELDTYRDENVDWPPPHVAVRFDYLDARPGVVVYVLLVTLMAWVSSEDLGALQWFSNGRVDAALIRAGEWWRAVTALTLHLDIAHLTANLVFGALFFYFAGRYFGAGIAGLAILLAGAVGNVLNSYLLAPGHTSVGASTAIFAALGMISAFAWKRRLYPQDRWAYRLGPIIAGIALLAYTGTGDGDGRTDVSAHLTGFGSGFAFGVALALILPLLPRGRGSQWTAGTIALAVIAAAWWRALAGG